MRRGDDADIHLARRERAQTLHFLILQRTQQLCLGIERHVADLVEEKRPIMRVFEQADFVLRGAGEGSTNVTEQFALEQSLDDGGTIERHELSGRHRTQLMQRPRNQLFARAGGACNQNGPGMAF